MGSSASSSLPLTSVMPNAYDQKAQRSYTGRTFTILEAIGFDDFLSLINNVGHIDLW